VVIGRFFSDILNYIFNGLIIQKRQEIDVSISLTIVIENEFNQTGIEFSETIIDATITFERKFQTLTIDYFTGLSFIRYGRARRGRRCRCISRSCRYERWFW
jgi:hypothetical protein